MTGAVSHGAFHEALNLAAALSAPVVFVCENNLYATSTPLATATRNPRIASRAAAYGIPGKPWTATTVLAVYRVMQKAAARAREGNGPTLIEARTYRTVGHHEGEPLAGTYRTQEEIDQWKRKCPILRLGRRLTPDPARPAEPSWTPWKPGLNRGSTKPKSSSWIRRCRQRPPFTIPSGDP